MTAKKKKDVPTKTASKPAVEGKPPKTQKTEATEGRKRKAVPEQQQQLRFAPSTLKHAIPASWAACESPTQPAPRTGDATTAPESDRTSVEAASPHPSPHPMPMPEPLPVEQSRSQLLPGGEGGADGNVVAGALGGTLAKTPKSHS
jgi:hypothetical protein